MFVRACALLLALCALVFNGAGLLAEAYSAYAKTALAANPERKAGVVATRYAAGLSPFDAALHSQFAWALYRAGQFDQARAAMPAALRLAPADADLWLRWSVMQLGCPRCYGALADAASRVNALAPRQADVQRRQAALALSQWPYGDAATHAPWLQSLHQTLENSPQVFVASLDRDAVSAAACVDLSPALPVLGSLCHDAR